ncbi:PLP-dependent aminotransferase family protein [Kitasatospora cineracea]|uniref:GntR family transcriptional regulator/MocR family aminotransferase n=1 Tax=Kitasatospora cineracea TaxID=88074 RepID=A0A8G1UPM4_9ACTN|nr:PLP-dependent aminotransferase family protein [Kitasatospora cineracea]ROR45422.1 GntR family transcriptional regulator/MocR family aminotransferase [Kitasatospora cineracea]
MRELLIAWEPGGGELAGRLVRSLRAAVREGRLAGGARLPASRVLAAELGVSRGVVVEAYEQLAAEGYLVGRQGSGTRVAEGVAVERPGEAVRVPAAEPRYDLKPGTPDLGAFPRAAWAGAVRRALQGAANRDLGYGDPAGLPQLRGELAAYLGRVRAVAAGPERVAVISGVGQGLALLVGLLARHGRRRIAVEDPGSPGTLGLLRAHGVEPVGVPVDQEGLVVRELAASGADAVLVTPAHQYPTGVALSARRRTELAGWARAGGLVVEDDYDAEFRYDREPLGAVQGLAPERTVYLGSLSKTLAPGLRLGWAVLPGWLAEDFRQAKQYADLGTGAVDQLAFAALLESGGYDRHLRAVRPRYRARRDALVGALREHLPQAGLRGVAAGLHLYADLPRAWTSGSWPGRRCGAGCGSHRSGPAGWPRAGRPSRSGTRAWPSSGCARRRRCSVRPAGRWADRGTGRRGIS